MDHKELLNRIRLIRTPTIGPITSRQLIRRYGNASKALEAIPELSKRGGKKIIPTTYDLAEKEFASLADIGGFFLAYRADDYPEYLSRFEDSPFILSCLGHSHLLSKPTLSIISARNASINSCKYAEKIASEIGKLGYVVVSGMARGIDRSAHEGALNFGTIAVLGNGINIAYPSQNKDIYLKIKETGLVLSEMPFGQMPAARFFPQRNRIIAALSIGCLVVEAAFKSGSLITASQAADKGVTVMAIPGSPLDPRAQGCNKLISEGAYLVQSVDEIVSLLSVPEIRTPKPPIQLSMEGQNLEYDEIQTETARICIMEKVSHVPIDIDELLNWCHVSAQDMSTAVLELELAGLIQRHYGNRISRILSV
ncbi:DNA-processing protein DprA [Alphaproteobacteria bacterium]|nr:DNA-processing protein DprA [Alphaproteobacteria bacterium]